MSDDPVTSRSMLPLRRRLVPVLAVLLGAPVSAELLQAYLSSTGELVGLVVAVVFFAPLYGGAALLVREVAVRTGRGWACRLLLAAAFGTAMTGVVDLSLFGQDRADIPYWHALRAPTAIDALGLSVAPALSWVAGHVVMSVGAPLAVLEGLAPAHRGRPLLGRTGLAVCALGFLGVAVLVFLDGRRTYAYVPTWWQVGLVGSVVAVLVALALGPPGRRVRPLDEAAAPVSAAVVVTIGLVGKTCLDLVPATWVGVVLDVVLAVGAVVGVSWLARHRRWAAREIGLLGASAILAGAVLGLTTPTPDPGSVVGKYVQGGVFSVIALALLVGVLRRAPGAGEEGRR